MASTSLIDARLEQRLVERMIVEKQCDAETASVVRCLYEQEIHQVRAHYARMSRTMNRCLVHEADRGQFTSLYRWSIERQCRLLCQCMSFQANSKMDRRTPMRTRLVFQIAEKFYYNYKFRESFDLCKK